jgi:hypothetical protein
VRVLYDGVGPGKSEYTQQAGVAVVSTQKILGQRADAEGSGRRAFPLHLFFIS